MLSRILSVAHQSRERETVAKPGHRRFEITRIKVLINALSLHRRVHIRPDEWNRASRNTTALVADLDCDIFLALNDNDFDRRVVPVVFRSESLDDGTKRILQQLEADMGQVTGNVCHGEVWWADELDGRTLEHGVVLLADESCVLDSFLDDVVDVGRSTNDTDVILMGLLRVKRDI